MSWKASKTLTLAVATAALLATSGAAWAEAIVVRATGQVANDYPPRTRLADDAVVRLRGTGTLTVLTRGGSRTYRQPGAYRLDAARSATRSVFASAAAGGGTARSGVSRGCPVGVPNCPEPSDAPAAPPRRNVWQASTQSSGTVCYLPAAPVSIWRPDATDSALVTLTRVSDNASVTVTFAQGQDSHAWPSEIAVAPNAEYRVEGLGLAQPTQLRFVALDSDPREQVEVMDGLLAQGCEAQADILVERAGETEGGAG